MASPRRCGAMAWSLCGTSVAMVSPHAARLRARLQAPV
uniref:Uncharacterized protein n=1 Tax=Arundo donax TaxID=35708 RepID=A0A0A8Z7W9_ARUDO